jgi:two-component system response regulator QseB
MRILVVEDDDGIAQGLKAHLRQQGWAVDVTDSVAGAWACLRAEPFDLVLLDLGLSDGDGAQVLRQLRAAPEGKLPAPGTPVLIMTARDQVASRIAGLDMGADDYVTKPFDPDELAARMRALARRAAGRAQATLQVGELQIDPAAHTVQRAGRRWSCRPANSACCWRWWSRARGCCRARRSKPSCTAGTMRWTATPLRCMCTTCAASWVTA